MAEVAWPMWEPCPSNAARASTSRASSSQLEAVAEADTAGAEVGFEAGASTAAEALDVVAEALAAVAGATGRALAAGRDLAAGRALAAVAEGLERCLSEALAAVADAAGRALAAVVDAAAGTLAAAVADTAAGAVEADTAGRAVLVEADAAAAAADALEALEVAAVVGGAMSS